MPTSPIDLDLDAPSFGRFALTAIFVGVLFGVLAILASIGGCSTTQPPVVQEAGKIAADCAEPVVSDLALHSLDDVASALVSADYSGGLRDVAGSIVAKASGAMLERVREAAWPAVKCAVTELFQQSGQHLRFGVTDEATAHREQLVRGNASAWLAAH